MRGSAVVVAVATLVFAASPSGSVASPKVLVYGDSLMSEARHYVEERLARQGWDVDVQAFPGTGLCDWLAEMPADAEDTAPSLVVITLSGVIFSSCNLYDTGTGARCVADGGTYDECFLEEWKEHWKRDSREISEFWNQHGADVLWVGGLPDPGATDPAPITAIYRHVAAAHDQHFVDAGRALRDRKGGWPLTLPCLTSERGRDECTRGRIQVRRSATNGHLCPISPPDDIGPCPVYSSGIVRWGGRIAAAASRLLPDDVDPDHLRVSGRTGSSPVMS